MKPPAWGRSPHSPFFQLIRATYLAALENIYVIDGKTCLSAHLIASRITESGKYCHKIINHTAQACSIQFYKRIDEEWEELGISEFTINEAKTANLLGKKNWQQYPKAMLYSRALSQGARWFCSSVFMGGIYVPEELESGNEALEITAVFS